MLCRNESAIRLCVKHGKIEFTISESATGKPEPAKAGIAINYKGAVELTKENAEGQKLEGAVFKIIDQEGNTVQEELTSDKDGNITASGLAPGRYAFVETKRHPVMC